EQQADEHRVACQHRRERAEDAHEQQQSAAPPGARIEDADDQRPDQHVAHRRNEQLPVAGDAHDGVPDHAQRERVEEHDETTLADRLRPLRSGRSPARGREARHDEPDRHEPERDLLARDREHERARDRRGENPPIQTRAETHRATACARGGAVISSWASASTTTSELPDARGSSRRFRRTSGLFRSIAASPSRSAATCASPLPGSKNPSVEGIASPTAIPRLLACSAVLAARLIARSSASSRAALALARERRSRTTIRDESYAAFSRTTSSPSRADGRHAIRRTLSPAVYSRRPKNSSPRPTRVEARSASRVARETSLASAAGRSTIAGRTSTSAAPSPCDPGVNDTLFLIAPNGNVVMIQIGRAHV